MRTCGSLAPTYSCVRQQNKRLFCLSLYVRLPCSCSVRLPLASQQPSAATLMVLLLLVAATTWCQHSQPEQQQEEQ